MTESMGVPGPTRLSILNDAMRVVEADRNTEYGEPEQNFSCIAEMWTLYLDHPVEAHDVAAMMALLKIARIKTSPWKKDHWVDLAGYAACGGEVSTPKGG